MTIATTDSGADAGEQRVPAQRQVPGVFADAEVPPPDATDEDTTGDGKKDKDASTASVESTGVPAGRLLAWCLLPLLVIGLVVAWIVSPVVAVVLFVAVVVLAGLVSAAVHGWQRSQRRRSAANGGSGSAGLWESSGRSSRSRRSGRSGGSGRGRGGGSGSGRSGGWSRFGSWWPWGKGSGRTAGKGSGSGKGAGSKGSGTGSGSAGKKRWWQRTGSGSGSPNSRGSGSDRSRSGSNGRDRDGRRRWWRRDDKPTSTTSSSGDKDSKDQKKESWRDRWRRKRSDRAEQDETREEREQEKKDKKKTKKDKKKAAAVDKASDTKAADEPFVYDDAGFLSATAPVPPPVAGPSAHRRHETTHVETSHVESFEFDDCGFPISNEGSNTTMATTEIGSPYAGMIDASTDATLKQTLTNAAAVARRDAGKKQEEARALRRDGNAHLETKGMEKAGEEMLREAARLEADAENRLGTAAAYEAQASGIR